MTHPLATRYSDGFDTLLADSQCSLAVTTYQAGQLVLLRPQADGLNTHYLPFNRPTGLAVSPTEWALGTGIEIQTFGLSQASLVDCPPDTDQVFAQRKRHITGDIDVHEMAYGDDGLWLVNTRFNALCTLDDRHSFVPRWRAPWIRAQAVEDCCHLNGLAMRFGRPDAVTALGLSDTPGGWRAHRADGGVVVDVASGEVMAHGLSMPHSPRWYDDSLWVLESGLGTLAQVEPASGRVEPVVKLPGVTRGLAFAGRYAFVGLSHLRDTGAGADVPISHGQQALVCGVWVVDLTRGDIVGAVAFTGDVTELFAVAVIQGALRPEVIVDASHNESLKRTYILPKQLGG